MQGQHSRFDFHELLHEMAQFGLQTGYEYQEEEGSCQQTSLDDYFDELATSLDGLPPENIVNYDESSLTNDPRKAKCIFRRGLMYPERVQDSSKSSISLMWAGAGDGTLLPLYVAY